MAHVFFSLWKGAGVQLVSLSGEQTPAPAPQFLQSHHGPSPLHARTGCRSGRDRGPACVEMRAGKISQSRPSFAGQTGIHAPCRRHQCNERVGVASFKVLSAGAFDRQNRELVFLTRLLASLTCGAASHLNVGPLLEALRSAVRGPGP